VTSTQSNRPISSFGESDDDDSTVVCVDEPPAVTARGGGGGGHLSRRGGSVGQRTAVTSSVVPFQTPLPPPAAAHTQPLVAATQFGLC